MTIGAIQLACGAVAAATADSDGGRIVFALLAAAGAGQVAMGVLTRRASRPSSSDLV
jgi:hypothetical protein